jgi:hypothetical protein
MSLHHAEVSPVPEGISDASLVYLGKVLHSMDTTEGVERGPDATDDSHRGP